MAAESIGVDILALVGVCRKEVLGVVHAVGLDIHLGWVAGRGRVEVKGSLLALEVGREHVTAVDGEALVPVAEAHGVDLVVGHGQGAGRQTGLLAVLFVVVTRGLEGDGGLAARGKTGTPGIAGTEVGTGDRGLAGESDLGTGAIGRGVGELIKVDEGVEILVVTGHIRHGGGILQRVFCEGSHGGWNRKTPLWAKGRKKVIKRENRTRVVLEGGSIVEKLSLGRWRRRGEQGEKGVRNRTGLRVPTADSAGLGFRRA